MTTNTALELYEINSEEDFKAAGPVLDDAYDKPFNSFWLMLKGPSEGELLTRLWQWHSATPKSQWIGVRTKDGKTIALAQWILHESNPFANGNPLPQVNWWSDAHVKDISQQAFDTFFGLRPKHMSRPHVLLNFCCVAQNHRRQGAGRMLMNWGRNLADDKGLESFVEATFDGIRLYESAGFKQIAPFVVDAVLPQELEGSDADKKAWLDTRAHILPSAYPGMLMWRPKGGDWKRGDKLQ